MSQDVEPGQPVRAQLAVTMSGIKSISQKMKGKAFVIETKFDGEFSCPFIRQLAHSFENPPGTKSAI